MSKQVTFINNKENENENDSVITIKQLDTIMNEIENDTANQPKNTNVDVNKLITMKWY